MSTRIIYTPRYGGSWSTSFVTNGDPKVARILATHEPLADLIEGTGQLTEVVDGLIERIQRETDLPHSPYLEWIREGVVAKLDQNLLGIYHGDEGEVYEITEFDGMETVSPIFTNGVLISA